MYEKKASLLKLEILQNVWNFSGDTVRYIFEIYASIYDSKFDLAPFLQYTHKKLTIARLWIWYNIRGYFACSRKELRSNCVENNGKASVHILIG